MGWNQLSDVTGSSHATSIKICGCSCTLWQPYYPGFFFQEADMTKIGAQEMKAFCGSFFMTLILRDLFSFEQHLHEAPSSDSIIIFHS